MKTVISSFANIADPDSDRTRSIFYRMPPSSLNALRGRYLRPDYSTLLVCDGLIVDAESYDRLTTDRHWAYNEVAQLFKALKTEGFIQLENFAAELKNTHGTIAANVANDIASDNWTAELRQSMQAWTSFIETIVTHISEVRNEYIHWDRAESAVDASFLMHALQGDLAHERVRLDLAKRDGESTWIIQVLPAFLTYVRTNIELSRRFSAPIHDWSDYLPFYRRLAAGQQTALTSAAIEATKLFTVTFPEFEPGSTFHTMRLLTDKRITRLREMIDAAVRGEVVFDRDFAVATLREALATERRLARFRSITSYAAMPLGAVPLIGTPLSKGVEEAAGAVNDKLRRRPLDWFYLISEAADAASAAQ